MMYYCRYGCSINDTKEIIEAQNEASALEYAYQKAIEDFNSYEGLHGIQSFDEFVEENIDFYENDEDDLIEAYNEYIENDIHYCVETFDFKNYVHTDTLDEQNGGAYNV